MFTETCLRLSSCCLSTAASSCQDLRETASSIQSLRPPELGHVGFLCHVQLSPCRASDLQFFFSMWGFEHGISEFSGVESGVEMLLPEPDRFPRVL